MLELHRLLLGDSVRNDAFVKALKKTIVPGKTVVADIGSGTGFLSFLAEKMGAKECHLYEQNPEMIALSKTLAKENGITRCHFYAGHSTEVKNPPKADIVLSETLGNWAYEENIIETMNDARRFLKPGGTIIPQELHCFVAPVTSSRLYDELNVWDRVGHGLEFSAAKEKCMNNMYVKDIAPKDLLGTGQEWDHLDFTKKNSSIREKTLEWKISSSTMFYGYACWWAAELITGIPLSTSPDEKPTHWKQIYLPLVDPLPVKAGRSVRLTLQSDSRYEVKINVAWGTEVLDRKGEILRSVRQDMRKGNI